MKTAERKLIVKYLQGECTTSEITQVENWLASSNENNMLFRETQRLWDKINCISNSIAVEKELDLYLGKINTEVTTENSDSSNTTHSEKKQKLIFSFWLLNMENGSAEDSDIKEKFEDLLLELEHCCDAKLQEY